MAQFVDTHAFESPEQAALALKNARLGLLLWRISNGIIFGFFIFANYLMRTVQPSWPPPGVARLDIVIPILISAVIIVSSLAASRVRMAMRSGDAAGATRATLITGALGIAFFAGLLIASAQVPYSGAYSSIVLAMNLFHALHVVIGLGLFAYVIRKLRRGAYTKERHWGLDASVIFWHFITLMWVFFFLVIYVL